MCDGQVDQKCIDCGYQEFVCEELRVGEWVCGESCFCGYQDDELYWDQDVVVVCDDCDCWKYDFVGCCDEEQSFGFGNVGVFQQMFLQCVFVLEQF